MTLRVSEISPPDTDRLARARVIDAALAEAGYPHECVSVTDQGIGVSRSWPHCDDWNYQVAVARAFDISAHLDPRRADRTGEVSDG